MSVNDLLNSASQVIDIAKKSGADSCDVILSKSTNFEVKVADGKIITLTQANSKGLGIRIFINNKMGFCTTSIFDKKHLESFIKKSVEMAKESTEDPYNGINEDVFEGRLDTDKTLELYDPKIAHITTEEKIRWAHELEQHARSVDPRIKKFQDSGVASGCSDYVLLTSKGAERTMKSSGISLWSCPIAVQNDELQTDFWYDSRTHLDDLDTLESIGQKAGKRTLRMLGAKPIKTQKIPVIFEPSMATGFLGSILNAIDGDSIFKKASFLTDKKDTLIATKNLTLVDDPHLVRGVASSSFDGEGLPTYKKLLIDKGYLKTFLYDTYTARKAGVKSTSSARRGYASLPHPGTFNFYALPGDVDPKDIYRSVDRAFLITRGLGRGIDTVTGEYSRGANGLLIEKGEVVHAVQEVTISGNYLDMLKNIDAIGTDFSMRGSSGSPTIRVANVTLSGL